MMRIAEVCGRTLTRAAASDRSIWVLDADLGDSYGLGNFAQAWPDRFIAAGIAEQNMVCMAAGMAACGAKPWVFSFACFLAYRAADQIRVSVAQTEVPVVLVASHAGGLAGRNGKTHQSLGDVAVVRSISGVAIWAPCDAKDAIFAVDTILKMKVPTYIRAPREHMPDLPGQPGFLRWLTEPADDVIICSGMSAVWALEVQKYLHLRGRRTSVLHVARVNPLPPELLSMVEAADTWFIIEDHVRAGGLADAIASQIRIQPNGWFGWPSSWQGGSGDAHSLRQAAGITTCDIGSEISRCLASSQPTAGAS